MGKIIVFSGADGTGKSSLISDCRARVSDSKYQWARYHHFFQRVFNMVARTIGRSWSENYGGEVHGYHDYSGLYGQIYLFLSLVDNCIALAFLMAKLRLSKKTTFVDRCVLDKIVDLATSKIDIRLILFFYKKLIKLEFSYATTFVVDCKYETIIARRPDLIFDKQLKEKINCYRLIARFYRINLINTEYKTVDECVEQVMGYVFE